MSSAAEDYAVAVDRVVAQRTRLRGPDPAIDLYADLAIDHVLLRANPRQPLSPNQQAILELIEPDDVVIDVGGGAGRYSLPLALRCREVINVDSSEAMGRAFLANAAAASIENARFIAADWAAFEPPAGTVALVNHVTYLTREIVPFIQRLEQAGTRRVIITVHAPPPTHRQHRLFELVYREPEARAPGHEALMRVLWELGRLPDLHVLGGVPPSPTRPTPDEAIATAIETFKAEQWAFWEYESDLRTRIETILQEHFDGLFDRGPNGFTPNWMDYGRDVLITWQPGIDLR